MKIQSLNGLNELIKKTSYYQSKKYPDYKNKVIDNCNLFMSFMIYPNSHHWDIKDFDPVPLQSTILRKRIGTRELPEIKKLLVDLDIIQINKSYLSQHSANKLNNNLNTNYFEPYSQSYSYTDNACDMERGNVKLISKNSVKKTKKFCIDRNKEFLNDHIHGKNLKSLFSYHFPIDKGLIELNKVKQTESPNSIKYHERSFRMLSRMNNYKNPEQYFFEPGFYYTVSKKTGRVYHWMATIPKVFRRMMTKKNGNKLAYIDLTNAQWLFLALNQRSTFKSKDNDNDILIDNNNNKTKPKYICGVNCLNKKDFLNDAITGDIYRKIAEQGKKRGDLDFYNLYKNNYGKFKKVALGNGLFYNLVSLKKIKPAERYLIDLYPEFMHDIRQIKRENNAKGQGHTLIPIRAQTSESSIFVYDYFKFSEIESTSIHDEIICSSKDAKKVKEILMRAMKERYPILTNKQLDNLFKIKYYE